jgi:hypothetical protein
MGSGKQIRVTIYKDDDYTQVVQSFARDFKLSEARTLRLLQVVREQIGLTVIEEEATK